MLVSKEKLMRFLDENDQYRYEVSGSYLKIIYTSEALAERFGGNAEIVILGKMTNENVLIERAFLVRGGVYEEVEVDLLNTWLKFVESLE